MTKEELLQYEIRTKTYVANCENNLKCEFVRFDNQKKEYLFIFDKTQPLEYIRLSRKALEHIGLSN